MTRMRRGLSLQQRQRMREEAGLRLMRRALARASAYCRSAECRQAMVAASVGDSVLAAELHKSCKAEDPDGRGCLCECHDPAAEARASGGVVSGSGGI